MRTFRRPLVSTFASDAVFVPARTTRASLALILWLATWSCGEAQVFLNGDFEQNPTLTGWAIIGDTDVLTSTFGTGPFSGTRQAYMTTDSSAGAVSASQLETFSGLSAGTLGSLGGGTSFSGSAIQQSLTITAAQIGMFINFEWNFLTDEQGFTGQKSFSYVNIERDGSDNVVKLAGTSSPLLHSSDTIWSRETGYQSSYVPITSAGNYTITFGVIDIAFNTPDSALLIDSVEITAVPEPAEWSLVAGLGVLGFLAARRQLLWGRA